MSEKRIRLTVAYDGTNYHGWQIQNNAITIEGVLNAAITDLLGRETAVIGASRTDAGVHAYGNIAVFDTDSPIPPEKMAGAINARLPEDVRIVKSEEVDISWHPRHQDCRKTYEYRILSGDVCFPTDRLYSYYTYRKLDVKKMQEAAQFFIGEHDFAAFCAADSSAETTIRKIYDVNVIETNDRPGYIIISVTGNGFLYNMVRIIAGTLFDVGIGKKNSDEIMGIIESLDRRKAGPTLPARGLSLIGYNY